MKLSQLPFTQIANERRMMLLLNFVKTYERETSSVLKITNTYGNVCMFSEYNDRTCPLPSCSSVCVPSRKKCSG